MISTKSLLPVLAAAVMFGIFSVGPALSQGMMKPQVANLITKVENGVDEFRDYIERRGENASATAAAPQGEKKRARRDSAAQPQKANSAQRKDELDGALEDLNRSTNRLRRKFDSTDTWMQTKAEVEKVLDDARKINQVLARGNYGTEATRLWGVLRSGVNDLARAYGLQPLAI